jgi:hypothetical protein
MELMLTLVIDLATHAKKIERPGLMRFVALFVGFQLRVCDISILHLYHAISYAMDHLPVQAVGEVVTVHADNHTVCPKHRSRSDMKDTTSESIAVDPLSDLWRQLEEWRSGGVLRRTVRHRQYDCMIAWNGLQEMLTSPY